MTRNIIDKSTPSLPWHCRNDKFGAKEAVAEQDKIGWCNALLGQLSTKWMDAQQKCLESTGKRTAGEQWTIAIISKLWDTAWDMWQHPNHITHNTLHPKKQLEMELLGQQLTRQTLQASANGTAVTRSATLSEITRISPERHRTQTKTMGDTSASSASTSSGSQSHPRRINDQQTSVDGNLARISRRRSRRKGGGSKQ